MWAQVLGGHLKDAKMNWDQWERGATALQGSRKVNLAPWTRAERDVCFGVCARILQHDGALPRGQRRSRPRHYGKGPLTLTELDSTRWGNTGLEQEWAEA